MKLEILKVQSLIAAKQVDLKLKAAINLICGSNEAGKSSIYEGIIHALTGESTRVSNKKDYKHLVNDGSTVGYCYLEYDGGKQASITLPNGAREIKEQMHSALPYLLDPKLFSAATEENRRSLITEITATKRDVNKIRAKLLERGCNTAKVDGIIPFLMSGFSNAEKQAIENTKDARSSWKTTTGEVYGDKKAVAWKAAKPEVDQSAVAVAQKALENISAEFDEENKKLGSLETEFKNAGEKDKEINGLREKSEKIERIETKLALDRKGLALMTVKVEDARRLSQGSTPDNIACKCPSCDSELFWNGKELVKREGDLQGDEDAAVKLPELESALTLLKNSVENGERDLVAARYAKDKLAEIEKAEKEVISEEIINQLKEKIEALRTKRKVAQEALDLMNENTKLAATADEKTEKAAGYHTDVQEWGAIAAALAPDGIPGEILKTAIAPVNDRLAKTSEITGWKLVVISEDMTISYGGKPYGLSSQSAKWRINVMIAEAISYVTGLKFFMCDEFDLLDNNGRISFIKWVDSLARSNDIETLMVFGTLKTPPTGLPSSIETHWISNGVIGALEAA
ncbi:RecF protein [Nitrosomonas sp. Is79A3]|uniref:AAA family ATPase n=1 Tax=Nitrosomonas sp. (strain Is79A3) TaxID=261292 RepID=UPI000215CFCF